VKPGCPAGKLARRAFLARSRWRGNGKGIGKRDRHRLSGEHQPPKPRMKKVGKRAPWRSIVIARFALLRRGHPEPWADL
jgi:hypothetical protein